MSLLTLLRRRGRSPLLASLVSHWSLEEASGPRAANYGGLTLTDNNTVTQAAGKVGNAAQFTAANNESLSIADNAALSMGDVDFTLGAWIYLDTLSVSRCIISKDDGSGSNREFLLSTGGSNLAALLVFDGAGATTSVTASTFGALSASTWYFVAAWHDSVNNQLGIQVNNSTPQTVSYSNGVRDAAAAFRLGTQSTSTNPFNGRIDEVFVSKRILTSTERTWLYNAGSGRSWADILAYRG